MLKFNKNDSIEEKQIKTRYTYSENIYQYLKYKKKLFDNIIGISPNFDYSRLDYLFEINVNEIIKSTDKDELYRIAINSKNDNVGDFYIYLIENNPKFIKILENKIELLLHQNKSFQKH